MKRPTAYRLSRARRLLTLPLTEAAKAKWDIGAHTQPILAEAIGFDWSLREIVAVAWLRGVLEARGGDRG